MRFAQRGFSLIEAMISLLVLSVGLLGLARLQTRLSMASSRLAAAEQAYVLGVAEIERSLAVADGDVTNSADTQSVVATPATRFELTNSRLPVGGLTRAEVSVQWISTEGPREIRLSTLAKPDRDPAWNRVFLPAER